ncbi:polysaccharide biosynthesis/export family protein [Methylomicrobium sp. Wu6]|uniref:polysaccharide biosynthesis/export family protein n=1 Tax=Methylomicrobium sp. Wu6 TaxID=3107928 RepID=UPI002DD631E3|nr:polysaccharide biosynthesis/export family protein [Methylomicrobium sp. Wu6]MEC4747781.1 polysaccharide biosynthesis/export family protein [Methylomicrobium sp. Wu6]
MNKILFLYVALLISAVASANAETNAGNGSMSNYELGAGDKILITVFREPDLTMEAKLTDAGTIIFPFLGEMNVKGLTVGKLKDKITQGLSGRYLKDPSVSVSVLEYREFFVNGEVKQPGAFPYFPGLTVQKAISIAGGFTERASQSSVLLEREKDANREGIEVELNAPIAPGDIVIVEESFF